MQAKEKNLIKGLKMYLHTAKSCGGGADSKCRRRAKPFCIAAAFLIICFPVAGTAWAQKEQLRKVLLLHSYHPNYLWTKLITSSVEFVLGQYKDAVVTDIEYMDTKHFDDQTHYENLYALYKNKFNHRKYELIITSDNDALLFLLKYRKEFCPDVPIVFCGVGDFNDSMLAGQEGVTGVTEEPTFEPTIEIALKLHPLAKQVVILDNRKVGKYRLREKQIEELGQKFSQRARFIHTFLDEATTEGLLKKIGGLGTGSIVILASTFTTSGRLDPYRGTKHLIEEKCGAPIYVLTERWFDYAPVMGGKLNCGYYQGRTAAELAVRILDGENPKNIPILRGTADKYMFDYIQLKRFGIDLSQLPQGSVIVNEPQSFYYLYKKRIWTVTGIILLLVAMVIILSGNIIRRRRAEKEVRLLQKQIEFILGSTKTGLDIIDSEFNLRYVDPEWAKVYGDYTGKKCYEYFAGRDSMCPTCGIPRAMRTKTVVVAEEVLPKEGNRPIQVVTVPFRDEQGQWLVAEVNIDITERKKAEERLIDYQRQLKYLASELSLTEERERHRIATELHDRIGQALVISKLKLALLRQSVSSGRIASIVDEVCNSLDRNIQAVRSLTFDLSSPILHEIGLEAAVGDWLTEQIQEKHGIESELVDDGEPKPLDNDVRIFLFRGVQELLVNVVKHANAHKVRVSMQKVDGNIHIIVEDDGVGFDVTDIATIATETGGFGLFSVRERLEQLGGRLTVESRSNCGAKVTMIAPLKDNEKTKSERQK
jgi:signal transduction histidine kinase